MTSGTLTLRPLFITRIAMFGFTLWLLGFVTVEAWTRSSGAQGEPAFGSPMDVAAFVVIPGVFLWMSWRLWRAGVELTESEVTVRGFFRDRTVPRSVVLGITMHFLVWERTDGEIQVTPITAFLSPGSGLADFVVRHNEDSLELLRKEITGIPTKEYGLGSGQNTKGAEDDRHFDPPTYRRPRGRQEPPKHAGTRKSHNDALPVIAMLTGSLLFTAMALWLLIEPALWLAGVSETPGMLRLIYSSDPYSRDSAVSLLLPHSLLAALALGMTVRLLYLILRPQR